MGLAGTSQGCDQSQGEDKVRAGKDKDVIGSSEANLLTVTKKVVQEVRNDMPVLPVIDQNVPILGNQIEKGAWKRRARQSGKRAGKESAEGINCDNDHLIGKRMFLLRDEKELDKENCLSEKKLKVGHQMDSEELKLVEVSSQEWPQVDQ